jgi:natural product precursor
MKKLSKKLKLNKETVSALTNGQMSDVKGGGVQPATAGDATCECHTVAGCDDEGCDFTSRPYTGL